MKTIGVAASKIGEALRIFIEGFWYYCFLGLVYWVVCDCPDVLAGYLFSPGAEKAVFWVTGVLGLFLVVPFYAGVVCWSVVKSSHGFRKRMVGALSAGERYFMDLLAVRLVYAAIFVCAAIGCVIFLRVTRLPLNALVASDQQSFSVPGYAVIGMLVIVCAVAYARFSFVDFLIITRNKGSYVSLKESWIMTRPVSAPLAASVLVLMLPPFLHAAYLGVMGGMIIGHGGDPEPSRTLSDHASSLLIGILHFPLVIVAYLFFKQAKPVARNPRSGNAKKETS